MDGRVEPLRMTTGDPRARLTPALPPVPDGPCHSLNVGEGGRGPRDGFRVGAHRGGWGPPEEDGPSFCIISLAGVGLPGAV